MSAKEFKINQIGLIKTSNDQYLIQVDKEYQKGLNNLNGFSHLQILWWAHLADSSENRENLLLGKLFKKGPEQMGVFATRAPVRPNPIMSSTIEVKNIDYENGIIYTSFIDAENNSPILDIKPYYPMERIKDCEVPKWCSHWPKWYEETIDFNWENEINFK